MKQSKRTIIALCFLLAVGSAWSQQPTERKPEPQRGPAFSASAYAVLVDVIVTDNNGKAVSDLRPEEFQISEDGVRQVLDSMEVQMAEASRITPFAPGKAPQAAIPTAPRVNLVTFLLDYSTTEFTQQKYVRDAAIRYVQDKLGPNDQVAVFSTAGGGLRALQGFTSDKKLLVASLATGSVAGSSFKGARRDLNLQIESARQGAQSDPGTASQSAGSGFTPGAAVAGGATGSARAAAGVAQRIENSFLVMRSFTDALLARPILTAIKSIALAEKDIPGRKTLILFSEGFVVPPNVEDLMRDAVDAANKANLAIYALDTAGLHNKDSAVISELESLNAAAGRARLGSSAGESLFDRARQVGSDQDESTLRFISNSTGGFLVRNTNDFEVGLQRIDVDLRTYYLLSYRPANLEFDGKFREIKVEVSRPGVRVRARNGYYATPPGDSMLTPDQRSLFQAARANSSAAHLPASVRIARLFPSAGSPVAVVTVEVPIDSLKFKQTGELLENRLQIVGLVLDEAGQPVSTFGRPVPLQFNKAQLEAARGQFIAHTENVVLDPGNYSVEVLIEEPNSRNFGYHSQQVAVEMPSQFRISDLVLSRQIVRVPAEETSADPLVSGEARIMPSAGAQFQNGDRLIFYFDIYHAGVREAAPDVDVTLSMLRAGKPSGVKLPVYRITERQKESGRIQVAKFLELERIPAGEYKLIVRANDRISGASGASEAAFTIVR